MNSRFRSSAKTCLLCAASGLLLGQGWSVYAQATAAQAKIAAHPGQPQQPAQRPLTDVERELQALYARDGQTMPQMNLPAVPAGAQARPAAAPAPAQVAARPERPSFLRRLFGGGTSVAPPSRNVTGTAPSPVAERQPAAAPSVEQAAVRERQATERQPIDSTSNQVGRPVAAGAPANQSEVQRRLEELYRKDGRQMPPMNFSEMRVEPGVNIPPGRNVPGGTAAQAGRPIVTPPQVTQSKPSFFQRLLPSALRSKAKPVPAPSQVAKSAAPQAVTQETEAPQRVFQPKAAPAIAADVTPHPAPTGNAPGLFPGAEVEAEAEVATLDAKPTLDSEFFDETMDPALDQEEDLEDLSLDSGLTSSVELSDSKGRTAPSPAAESEPEAEVSPFSGNSLSPVEVEMASRNPAVTPRTLGTEDLDEDDDEDDEMEFDEEFGTAASDRPQSVPTPATLKEIPDGNQPLTAEVPLPEGPSLASQSTNTVNSAEKGLPTIRPQTETTAESKPSLDSEIPAPQDERSRQLQLLASRAHLKGLKGFCPVTLKNERRLVDAHPKHRSMHESKLYLFASEEAKAEFDAAPEKYAPAALGCDVVRMAEDGAPRVEGSLDHAAWYKGKLYLFSEAASRDTFVRSPAQFAEQNETVSFDLVP